MNTLIWITGLPGSGKTTLATQLAKLIYNSIHIDGDDIRKIYKNDLGYTMSDRQKNAKRIILHCENAIKTNNVICSTVSLFHSIHKINKETFSKYIEIMLEVPKEILSIRRPELYPKLFNTKFEIPQNPNIILSSQDINSNIKEIINYVGLHQFSEILR